MSRCASGPATRWRRFWRTTSRCSMDRRGASASVAATAADYGLTVMTPVEANTPEIERAVAQLRPDFLFSFYYRSLLGVPLLTAARRGALNMHGSLLPKYRGRAPVNWAIVRGE